MANPPAARACTIMGVPAQTRRSSRAAKETIAEVFEALGGVDAMVAWVQASPDHEKTFYSSTYPKLISVQLAGEEEPVEQELTIRFV